MYIVSSFIMQNAKSEPLSGSLYLQIFVLNREARQVAN